MKKKDSEVVEEVAAVEETSVVDETVTAAPANPVKEKKPKKSDLAQQEADAAKESGLTNEVYYGPGPWPKLSRMAATILGFTRYYTGEPCANGHDAPRKTKTASCLTCSHNKLRERHKSRMKDDIEYKKKFAAKAKARRLSKKKPVTVEPPPSE